MRVIAGRHRGQRLLTPPGLNTRPILDRVKASVFDWLGARLAMPGYLPPIHVCDIFCGAGSLGIEALSHGAAYCAFVDTDAAALSALRRNIDSIRAGRAALIVPIAAQELKLPRHEGHGYSLLFCDPPYELSRDLGAGSVLARFISRLGSEVPIEPDALLLWRHDAAETLPSELGDAWKCIERRTWGSMAVTAYQWVSGSDA